MSRYRSILPFILLARFGVENAIAEALPFITIVAFGDSLSAGYGVAKKDSYPAQLEQRKKQR